MSVKFNFVVLLIISVLSLGCGTDSGNPGLESCSAGAVSETFSLVLNICGKINTCQGSVADECYNKVYAVEGIPEKIGAPKDSYLDLKALGAAVNKGDVVLNSNKADNCKSEIYKLDCSSPLVTEGFEPVSRGDYSQVGRLFETDPSCKEIVVSAAALSKTARFKTFSASGGGRSKCR